VPWRFASVEFLRAARNATALLLSVKSAGQNTHLGLAW
jgi:hypothetical protein